MAATTPPTKRKPRTVTKPRPPVTPATWDFDDFLGGFQRPEFPAFLIQRGDLAPKLGEQLKVLEDLDSRIDRLEAAEGDEGVERDITAVDPLSELVARRQRLTEEYNDTAQLYNDSAVEFRFRTPDKKEDKARIDALMADTGLTQPTQPDKVVDEDLPAEVVEATNAQVQSAFEKEFGAWWDALAIRSMAVTCIEHPGTKAGAPPLTVAQWEALRERVGVMSFVSLATAWFDAVQAGAPTVPFSPRPLPTPTDGTP